MAPSVEKGNGYKTVSGNDRSLSLEKSREGSITWADVVRDDCVKG